jgi:Ca2+-binding EF-hand superfamily protein
MTEKQSEEKILFPEVTIAGFKILPWGFGHLFNLAESLGKVIEKAEAKGLIEELDNSGGILKYTTIAKLLSIASSEVFEIIKITLNTDDESVKKLSMEDGLKIAFTIYDQNKTTIINSIKNLIAPNPNE